MPRIDLVSADAAEPRELVDAIRARRGGKLFAVDRMVLSSPSFAEGFNYFAPRVRFENTVSREVLEIAICLVGLINGAQYEYHHHLEIWRELGATAAQIEGLSIVAAGGASTSFGPAEQAVIALTVEMTRSVAVSDETFGEVRRHFDDRQIFDLVAIIAFYNMVSRMLVALGVQVEDDG